jgi:hypothetical protein
MDLVLWCYSPLITPAQRQEGGVFFCSCLGCHAMHILSRLLLYQRHAPCCPFSTDISCFSDRFLFFSFRVFLSACDCNTAASSHILHSEVVRSAWDIQGAAAYTGRRGHLLRGVRYLISGFP